MGSVQRKSNKVRERVRKDIVRQKKDKQERIRGEKYENAKLEGLHNMVSHWPLEVSGFIY